MLIGFSSRYQFAVIPSLLEKHRFSILVNLLWSKFADNLGRNLVYGHRQNLNVVLLHGCGFDQPWEAGNIRKLLFDLWHGITWSLLEWRKWMTPSSRLLYRLWRWKRASLMPLHSRFWPSAYPSVPSSWSLERYVFASALSNCPASWWPLAGWSWVGHR